MLLRGLILVFGPVLLIGGCYFLTLGRNEASAQPDSGSSSRMPAEFDVGELERGSEEGLAQPVAKKTPSSAVSIERQCDQRARQLSSHLAKGHRIIVRPPYILAGDLSEEELDHHYSETVLPTARALQLAYFDAPLDEPITLLLFSSERAYRDAANTLDRRDTTNYYGYYIRTDRRIVINIGTGEGTLSHELAHALGHFDFPNMPEWFDEGLASIYEEAAFTDDGLQLVGISNWRLNHLLHAMQKRKLQTLESLITSRKIRSERQDVDYAHSRYFCLYLQERGLLPFFYRKFRANVETDPSGLRTLCEIFDTPMLDPIDRDFRKWVIELYQEVRGSKS
jgi:hypothetical protein